MLWSNLQLSHLQIKEHDEILPYRRRQRFDFIELKLKLQRPPTTADAHEIALDAVLSKINGSCWIGNLGSHLSKATSFICLILHYLVKFELLLEKLDPRFLQATSWHTLIGNIKLLISVFFGAALLLYHSNDHLN